MNRKLGMALTLAKFLKFYVRTIASQACCIKIQKAKIDYQWQNLLVSIKDPFVKGLNHGSALRDKTKHN